MNPKGWEKKKILKYIALIKTNKKTLFSHRYLPEQERDRKRSWPFALSSSFRRPTPNSTLYARVVK